MNALTLPDIAAQASRQALPLDWVGMCGIALPILIDGQRLTATADAGVSLDDGSARGIHMSRLYLALEMLGPYCSQTGREQLEWLKTDTDLDPIRADARLASVEASVPQLQAEQVRHRRPARAEHPQQHLRGGLGWQRHEEEFVTTLPTSPADHKDSNLAVNLGDTATDASCLSTHPSGGKAQRAVDDEAFEGALRDHLASYRLAGHDLAVDAKPFGEQQVALDAGALSDQALDGRLFLLAKHGDSPNDRSLLVTAGMFAPTAPNCLAARGPSRFLPWPMAVRRRCLQASDSP